MGWFDSSQEEWRKIVHSFWKLGQNTSLVLCYSNIANKKADPEKAVHKIKSSHFIFPLPCSHGHQNTRPTHEGKHRKRTQYGRSPTACGPGIHTIRRCRWEWRGHTVITPLYMKLSRAGTAESKGQRTLHTVLHCEPEIPRWKPALLCFLWLLRQLSFINIGEYQQHDSDDGKVRKNMEETSTQTTGEIIPTKWNHCMHNHDDQISKSTRTMWIQEVPPHSPTSAVWTGKKTE